MRLYGYWRSSSSWRVRIALAYKELAYEYAPVHLLRDGGEQLRESYRAKNPMAQVPLLEVEEGGRRRFIAQSMAILEYLEERHPEPPLLPADRYLRARARQLAEIVNSGIQPLQNLAVLGRVRDELGGDDQAWARHWIARGLAALEETSRETAGAFLVADAPSFADLCLVPQLFNARRFGVDLASYPTLTRVEAACLGLPAFQVSHPDRQPDAQR